MERLGVQSQSVVVWFLRLNFANTYGTSKYFKAAPEQRRQYDALSNKVRKAYKAYYPPLGQPQNGRQVA